MLTFIKRGRFGGICQTKDCKISNGKGAAASRPRLNPVGSGMAGKARLVFFLLVTLFLAREPGSCAAGQIQALATDLTDTTPGQDLWRFTYTLDSFTFQANEGFSVFFDFLKYTDLHNPTPNPSAIWSAITVQPDLLLDADGFFDAQALVNLPATSGSFSVDFTWLGTDAPGAQPFYTYDSNFHPVFTGTTVVLGTGVPEPEPWMLSGMGAVMIYWRASRNQKKK